MSDNLPAMLIRDEGLKTKPYLDCCGKPWRDCVCSKKGALTVGVGRNLDELGISESEAKWLLDRDITRVTAEADGELAWFSRLDQCRQDVVLSMVFNMGVTRFRGFQKMIEALARGDYSAAADEMTASHWASELPERSARLADMMRKGGLS